MTTESSITPHAITLETDAIDTDWVVTHVEGHERIGMCFRWHVTLVMRHDHASIELEAILGAPVRLVFRAAHGQVLRSVEALVRSARERSDETITYTTYELTLVPDAWRLTQITTQEIYMGMSIPEIVFEKLARHGLAEKATVALGGTYPRREYVVQYKETDLAFVSRLVEHWGISFYFDSDSSRLTFADHPEGMAQLGSLPFRPDGFEEGVFELATSLNIIPAVYVVSDYNYRMPDVDLTAVAEVEESGGGGVIEYGTHHRTPDEGARLAVIRAQEARARRKTYDGRSTVCALAAGSRFNIDDHARLGPLALLATEVHHEATQAVAHATSDAVFRYRNRFTATPADSPYRPAHTTPVPRIPGVVSAIVQPGPRGEIGGPARLDEQGRYTVHFHFDSTGHSAGPTSRRVRMMQPFGGTVDGMHFPLRPGVEVVLAFVDGDPDRPLMLGVAPNPQMPAPVTNENPRVNRIQTETGILIEFGEAR